MRNFLRLSCYRFSVFILFLSGCLPGFSQQSNPTTSLIQVRLQIINQKKEPVSFATVVVTDRFDSIKTQTGTTDKNGSASFTLTENQQYIIKVTAIDYQPIEKGIIVSTTDSLFVFEAEPAGKTLEEAVVVSRKPIIRQEDDKTIVDAETLAEASTSGYEVIEKTPGLFIDQDGNIYISSLTPAAVQINGRDMKMSAADIASLLKSLPPNVIDKIEIVRTPSAKYDASGTGGVVNVVLKKGIKIGMTGSVNTGFQQGTYGNQFIGISINNNTGKKSSNLNINYNRRNNYERIVTDRLFATDSSLDQNAFTKYLGDGYYAAYGITFEVGKKWELTYDANATYNNFNNRSENNNRIEKSGSPTPIASSLNNVQNKGNSLMLGTGFESKLKIDSTGSEWANDTWFSHTKNNSNQFFSTTYLMPALPSTGGDGTADNTRDYFNFKSDLKLKLQKKITLETGVHTYINSYKNETNYFRESGGVRSVDKSRTNTFRYHENINALYLQGSKTLGKDFIVKAGTRMENTNMKGRQFVPGDTSFTIHRTDLFPYIYLSKKVMTIAGFDLRAYLVYRRTIKRPYYDQLNPFSRYIDEYLTEVGNPSLRPQFTQNYEANISVDERPILAVGINDTKDIFTNVIYQADSSRSQAYRTYDNLGKNKEWYLRGLGAIPPGGKYFFVIGAQYNYNIYNGLYENKPLSFKRGTWTLFTYHNLKLDKKSQLTVNGFVRFKGQQQFYELSSFGALNASLNRKFLKDKLTISVSISDMFATNKNDFSIKQGSIDAFGYRQADTRRFGLNIRYSFGIRKKEEGNNLFNQYTPPN